MFEIDRIVAIIKPTAKMFKWLQDCTDSLADLTLEELRADCTALLIPAFDEPELAEQYIEEIYAEIFEHELELWVTDEELWPKDRTLKVFSEWFQVEYHSMVLDLGDLEGMEKEAYSSSLQ